MKRIFITTGDPDGVGLEVTAKALNKLGPQKGIQFVVFRSSHHADPWLKLIKKKFKCVTSDQFLDSHFSSQSYTELLDINSPALAPHWVTESTRWCLKNSNCALVTGPLSKPLFVDAGYKVMGHTGLLKKLSGVEDIHMAFYGKYFNVLLATDHIPLKKVSQKITAELLDKTLSLANEFRQLLPRAISKRPMALLGLNPHAGDSGLIGCEEEKLLQPFVKNRQKKFQPLVGPLVPDAAFAPAHWKQYSLYICLYHDQGLIPFKTVHGQNSGIQISMGLPFTRVSVDHGTAKDIFNKNKANPNSMLEAVEFAIKSLQRKIK
ncbi:MAG: 4-hydroxythreonine-4-phosphate dehydrogenase PdxA [Bdellovibrionales bacterium]|nr:4-hydroxythreonine-4-phosphate dehydrogenase PdxA [Bdellovibrionales bacterium]